MPLNDVQRLAWTLLLASAAGALLHALRSPLPWLIGPLLVTAIRATRGVQVNAPRALVHAGQWSVGCALGLYFTPQVVDLLVDLAPAVVAGALWTLLLGYAFYRWLWRRHGHEPGMDRTTAFFSATIGGASEMTMTAQLHGGRVDRVAAAHTLRILIVVLLVPFGVQAAGFHGADAVPLAVRDVHLQGLAVLVVATLAAAYSLHTLRAPMAWLLGPLAASLLLTASGANVSALPRWVGIAGQVLIGVSLGARFSPLFARAAPRWLASVALGTVGMIVLSALFAWGLASVAGLHPATVLLATSPGGIAEMCLTAQSLQLGVPVVTVFHVVRSIVVLLSSSMLYRRIVPASETT